MEVAITLMIQKTIRAKDDDEYEAVRDQLIEELEEKGWSVNIESEEDE